ncbi:MAG: hypothetical protein LC664_13520 [Flavobacteriales bacterium]|nr:hypothetical protein [Flavobacteriales bacterium]
MYTAEADYNVKCNSGFYAAGLQLSAAFSPKVNPAEQGFKLSLVTFCCIVSYFAVGQTVPFPTHTDNDTSIPFPEKMDDVFGNIDLTDVTTNLLLDRVWPFPENRFSMNREFIRLT